MSFLLSFASSLLFILSFPKWNLGLLAWVSLLPALFAVEGRNWKQAFGFGFLTGWMGFCGILCWIVPTFNAAQVSPFVGIFSTALLAGYIALYFGVFFAGVRCLGSRISPAAQIVWGAALWVALEFARNHLFTGFPWASLGHSQWKLYPLIQISEWTGVYGISFAIAAFNLMLFQWIKNLIVIRMHVFVFGVFALSNGLLFWVNSYEKPEDRFRVSVLQGNVNQYKKWSDSYVGEILEDYSGLVRQCFAEKNNNHLIIWPETSVPGWLPDEKMLMDWTVKQVRGSGAFHVIGSVTRSEGLNFNSAFLFAPDGNAVGRYDKMHLVPFGEFVPLQGVLSRWVPLLSELGGFSPGKSHQVLPFPPAAVGAGICYESIFPEISRRSVNEGAEILVNLTNDGWYLDTAAPEQHFSMNVFRAVENRRYLIRAANTGISGVINPLGKVRSRTALGEKTVLTDTAAKRTRKTLYTRFGDWFAWGCIMIALAGAGFILKGRSHEIA